MDEQDLYDALEDALLRWEAEGGALVAELRDKAVHAALDVVYGQRCQGCGDRGGPHGPGVCI